MEATRTGYYEAQMRQVAINVYELVNLSEEQMGRMGVGKEKGVGVGWGVVAHRWKQW